MMAVKLTETQINALRLLDNNMRGNAFRPSGQRTIRYTAATWARLADLGLTEMGERRTVLSQAGRDLLASLS